MAVEALFERAGSRFVPSERSLGPWGQGVLHGGAVAALLAFAVETADGADADLLPLRLSVDLYRAVPLAPLEIDVRILRAGRRLRVIAAALAAGGMPVAHGLGLLARPSDEPAAALPQSAGAMRPPGDFVPVPVPREPVSHATSLEIRGRMRHETGVESEGLWIRPLHPVVAGTALTPFTRAATAADWANPVANYGPMGIHFINADITLYLHRPPEGEWLGLAPAARNSRAGIAVSDCTLHDLRGPVGRCLAASLATSEAASGRHPAGAAR
jgi:acyl-coenzyme A thioesterase PaaI-like protein